MRRGRPMLSRGLWPLLVGLALILVVVALPAPAVAWDDCPKGVTELCTGACSRFIDTNGDGYCDHSQPEPAPPTTATAVTSPPTTAAPLESTSASGSISGTDAAAVAMAATGMATTTTLPSGTGGDSAGAGATAAGSEGVGGDAAVALPSPAPSAPTVKYNLSPIAVMFFLVYAVSFVLYKTRRMRAATHRKIWNVLLLLTFLLTGVMGLLLTIRLNYGLRFNPPFDMLFWHVETGIVMSLISFFHIGWHLKYYRSLLRRRSTACEEAREAARVAREACSQDATYSPLPARATAGGAATQVGGRRTGSAAGMLGAGATRRAASVPLEGNAQSARR